MRKLVLIVIIVAILGVSLFTLSGCSITTEADDNSISVSVDEETQNTFERIVDWIVERLDRIFDNDTSSGGSYGEEA